MSQLKIRIYSILLLVQALAFCHSTDDFQSQREIKTELPTKIMSREEMETIKACNIQLDKCLKKCDSESPDMSILKPQRGKCRDRCVAKLKGTDNCLIHYHTFRTNKYPTWFAP